jgi:tRNA modification GTPase
LVDTAGLRVSDHPLEQTGMALAEREVAAADLVVLVFDRSQPLATADAALIASYPSALVVENKADLPRAETSAAGLAVSALGGMGVDVLTTAISARLVPEPPRPGAAVPFTESQVAQVESLLAETRRTKSG